MPPGGYDPNMPPGGFGATPGGLPPGATPQRRGGKWKIVLAIVGVVLLVCCVGGVVLVVKGADWLKSNPGSAKVGDCLAGQKIDESSDKLQEADLEIAKCSDADAKYVVVGRVENKTQSQAETDANICAAYTETTTLYWQGNRGEKGTVLCLKDKK